jgi:hypothetical protein
MKNLHHVTHYAPFLALLLATISLFGMKSDQEVSPVRFDPKNYGILREALACSITHMDHALVCTMAMVSRAFNQIMCDTAKQRREYLRPYIALQPNLMQFSDQQITWHVYGSACAFITTTDQALPDESSYVVNLCRLQIRDNGVVNNHVYPLMKSHTSVPIGRDGEDAYCVGTMDVIRSNTYYKVTMLPALSWVRKRILFPVFDRSGSVCVYHYRVNSEKSSADITEICISNHNTATPSTCRFEFEGRGYSLRVLECTPYLNAFINSSHTQRSDSIKTFMSDGVTIKGAPLSEIDMCTIKHIIGPSQESHKINNCVIS